MERHGAGGPRIYWTTSMLEKLKRDYPTSKDADIAIDLNVNFRLISKKAHELGLKKARGYLLPYRQEICRALHIMNASRSHLSHLTKMEKIERKRLINRLHKRWIYHGRKKSRQQWLKEEYGIDNVYTLSLEKLREKAALIPGRGESISEAHRKNRIAKSKFNQ